MGIKLSHKHNDGKECFVIYNNRGHKSSELTETGIIYALGGRYGIGYKPYTGSWYGYDLETGQEIAQFSREFYERQLKMLMHPLISDPDCEI